MPEGVQTCPSCLMKVFPLTDGLCPSCRRFNFNSSPSDEKTVAAARAAADLATAARIRDAAVLHWRVVGSLVAAVGLTTLRVYVKHYGTGAFDQPPLDKDRVAMVVSIGALAAVGFAWQSASALASTIQLVSGGMRTPNMLTVLKESMGFFADHHVATGLLGPRRTDLSQPR